jgi:hypothetical protein
MFPFLWVLSLFQRLSHTNCQLTATQLVLSREVSPILNLYTSQECSLFRNYRYVQLTFMHSLMVQTYSSVVASMTVAVSA